MINKVRVAPKNGKFEKNPPLFSRRGGKETRISERTGYYLIEIGYKKIDKEVDKLNTMKSIFELWHYQWMLFMY